jgi:hypothetical protein
MLIAASVGAPELSIFSLPEPPRLPFLMYWPLFRRRFCAGVALGRNAPTF